MFLSSDAVTGLTAERGCVVCEVCAQPAADIWSDRHDRHTDRYKVRGVRTLKDRRRRVAEAADKYTTM